MPKKPKKPKLYLPKEKEVEKGCINLLKSLGFGVYKTSQPRVPIGMTSTEKRKTKLRASQVAFKKLCEESGVPYRVFHSTEELWDWLVEDGFIRESRS